MTREDTIRQIIHREAMRLELSEQVVQQDAAELHRSACEQFGTWDTALQYAGVSVRHVRPREQYTPDRVTQEIRTLCISGYSISSAHIMRRNRRLYEAARQHFGTWRKALVAAGVNLKHAFLGRPRKHDRQQILDTIKLRHTSGLSLVWSDVSLENRAFAVAAKHTFGSWRKALLAAEIDPAIHRDSHRKEWDEQRVIDCLRQRQREGKSLKCADVRREHPPLVNAVNRYFGSWRSAIRAAGVDWDQG
ncbi:MAG: hypothetical protein RIC55_02265 [Pirellulaceae bacterium]